MVESDEWTREAFTGAALGRGHSAAAARSAWDKVVRSLDTNGKLTNIQLRDVLDGGLEFFPGTTNEWTVFSDLAGRLLRL